MPSQDRPNPSMSSLHQKLHSFFTIPSHPPHEGATTPPTSPMNSSARTMDIHHSPPPSQSSHTGSLNSCPKSKQRQRKVTSMLYTPSTLKTTFPLMHSMIPESTLSSEEENVSMVKRKRDYDFLSPHQSSSELSTRSEMMKRESMSKQRSVWHLPPSYDLENLHGIHGLISTIDSILPTNTSNLTPPS